MASLTGTKVSDTYQQLLKLTSQGVGADASAKYIEDGLGTDTALSLSTTRVGIGTASPAKLLHVNAADGEQDNTAVAKFVNLESTSGRSKGVDIQAGTDNDDYMLSMDDQSGSTKFRFTGAGRLGIGTGSPSNQLHLESATSTTMLMKNTGNSGSQIDGDANRSSADSTIMGIVGKWNGTTVGDMLIVSGSDTTNKDDGEFVFRTAPSGSLVERLRIKANGEVQFGSSGGTADLYHYGEGKFAINNSAGSASTPTYSFNSDVDTGMYRIGANEMGFATGGSERMRITSTGNVYLGGVTSQVNTSHFQYASTFGDQSYARVGFFNQATGNYATRGMNLQLGQIAGTSHWCAEDTELAIITFLGQANDAGYVGGSIAVKNTTGGNIGRAATGCDMMFSTIDTSGTGAEERMRITSGGDVGINDTSPTSDSGFNGPVLRVKGSTSPSVIARNSSSGGEGLMSTPNEAGLQFAIAGNATASHNYIMFRTGNTNSNYNSTERMRITSDGKTQWGTYTGNGSTIGVSLETYGNGYLYASESTGTSAQYHLYFLNGNGNVGRIETTASQTNYVTSSDYRLKENEVLISDGLTRLNQLKPYRFNFIADADTTVDGFFAHEVAEVVPQAVTGEKDAVDDDGNIVSQGIDQSKLVPLLVKAVQELSAKVEALTARLDDLEPEEPEQEQSPTVKERVNSLEARVNDLENG